MADFTYINFKSGVLTETHHMTSDTFKVALVSGTYTPSFLHTSYTTHILPHEVAGTNYTAGGATLANKAIVIGDASNNFAYFTADPVVWSSSTITASGAVVYNDTAAGKPVVSYIDLGGNRSSSSGTFQIAWSANGIVRLSE